LVNTTKNLAEEYWGAEVVDEKFPEVYHDLVAFILTQSGIGFKPQSATFSLTGQDDAHAYMLWIIEEIKRTYEVYDEENKTHL
jgi:hypothetical protein